MARILSGIDVWVAGLRVSELANDISLSHTADVLEATTLSDTARVRVGGLKTSTLTLSGYVDANGENDTSLARAFELVNDNSNKLLTPVTVAPVGTSTSWAQAFTALAVGAEYSHGGAVGDLHSFTLTLELEYLATGFALAAYTSRAWPSAGATLAILDYSDGLASNKRASVHIADAELDALTVIMQRSNVTGGGFTQRGQFTLPRNSDYYAGAVNIDPHATSANNRYWRVRVVGSPTTTSRILFSIANVE